MVIILLYWLFIYIYILINIIWIKCVLNYYLQISNWTKYIPNVSKEVFSLVLKNSEDKLSKKQINDLKTLISNNYPDVKFSFLNIRLLKTFKENLKKIFNGIDVEAVLAADNISEHDLVAIASGSKYKSVSYYFETTELNFQHIFIFNLKL